MRVVLCVAILLSAGFVHAQGVNESESRWLFVPVLTGELPARTPSALLTAPWERAIRSEGELVVANESAASLFESRHSSEPVRVDTQRLDELVRIIDEGQKRLSRTERESAQQTLKAVSAAEREFLLRDPEQAQKLFDACMMTAALLLREKKTAEAESHVNACAEGFPGFFPPKRKGPPPFQALVARVQKQREQAPSGTLSVTSEPHGCAVRLNGGVVGKTPASITNVGVGIVHVQIECDPHTLGRTHAISVRVGDNRLEVDGIFEAALHTRDGLWLSFPSDDVRQRQARSSGERIGRVLGNPRIVLLLLEGQGDETLVRPVPLFMSAGPLKPIRWRATDLDEGALRANIQALRQAFPPPTKPPTKPVASEPAPPARPRVAAKAEVIDPFQGEVRSTPIVTRNDWPSVVAGATATVVGVGAIAVSWMVYTQRQTLRTDLRAEVEPQLRADFESRGDWVFGSGILGSVSLTAAMPFLLPQARHVPAWAWAIGGLGVAVVSTGIGYGIFERHCQPTAGVIESGCRRFTADGTFGPLLMLHGLPLLSVPVTYLVREWARPSRGIQVSVDGGILSVQGRF